MFDSAAEIGGMDERIPGFGDNVRIRSTPLTQQLGYAGRSGSVYGETTPSAMGIEVIGDSAHDFALNVCFDDSQPEGGLWFAPELVEFVDHAPGTAFEIAGTRVARRADGEWEPIGPTRPGFISRLMHRFRRRK
jgi:hypothetical protein